ncbi:hypothetical protein HGRIS_011068 [Hohenbuehelia grisea]|uniref:Glycosyltransferase family 15 protein n=1 Tax=Hohenbuehelia grisea TaxID=104357 RepID=A0ABR3IYT6_9AGAR
MNTPARYFILVLVIIISLHYILSFAHEEYGRVTSISNITSKFRQKPIIDDLSVGATIPDSNAGTTTHPVTPSTTEKATVNPPSGSSNSSGLVYDRRANATFVILARNTDIDGAVRSIRDIEDRFNRKYRYPYVFLNEVEFDDNFKQRISVLTSAPVEFGVIPHDHWFQPDWIDEDRAKAGREQMEKDRIIYGGSVSYRNMCRFNSGFFFKHPLVQKYRWYWRIEPDVHFHCDINFDPFVFMEDNNKRYAFTITMYEYHATIPTLWSHVKAFTKLHPEHIAQDNALGFMSTDGGDSYNLCHFWSNFEIADMDFWRGPAYQAFFEYLDKQGGFYYEVWTSSNAVFKLIG